MSNLTQEHIDKIEASPTFYELEAYEGHEGFILLDHDLVGKFQFRYFRKAPITYIEYHHGRIVKDVETMRETDFEIDLVNKLLIVYGDRAQCEFLVRKLEAKLGALFTPVSIEFSKVFDLLKQSKYICRPEMIEIDNFVYRQALVGKYSARVFDADVLKITINEFGKKVASVMISLEDYDENRYLVKIDKDGFFRFNTHCEDDPAMLEFLISNLP